MKDIIKEKIKDSINQYEQTAEEYAQELNDEQASDICAAKAAALKEVLTFIESLPENQSATPKEFSNEEIIEAAKNIFLKIMQDAEKRFEYLKQPATVAETGPELIDVNGKQIIV